MKQKPIAGCLPLRWSFYAKWMALQCQMELLMKTRHPL
jgi:hypothetical protein